MNKPADTKPAMPRKRLVARIFGWVCGAIFTIHALKIALGATVVLSAGAGGLMMYSSRPEFCTSCHYMQPYYDSWKKGSHKNVTCIACHFPPGMEGFISGKIAAISQVALYFTGTQGPKPFAHIRDESCMRSGCHSLEGLIPTAQNSKFKSKFNHEKHLAAAAAKAGVASTPAAQFTSFLTCASCHTQILRDEHMTVNRDACTLCHLRSDAPPERSKCTLCHEAPGIVKIDGGTFDHKKIEKSPVDCKSCHAGLNGGTGHAPKQRCMQCHNSLDNLSRIGDKEFIHQKHVREMTIDCQDCHLEIRHSLEKDWVEKETSCETCHPNHHTNQRKMFAGTGAHEVEAIKSPMFKVRAGCLACHMTLKHNGGELVLTADAKSCDQCHDKGFGDILEGWKSFGSERGGEIAAKLEEARKSFDAYKGADTNKNAAATLIKTVEANLALVKLGHAAHNFPYAESIFDQADKDLEAIHDKLK
ncbi:MAG: NapC/NirT family cytochrome c [Planctomycetes bacterium]|nr:NapC/NirT family cytochrome c [Planctomycetota bacterium]